MRVAGRDAIEAFMRSHADARRALRVWLGIVEASVWNDPAEMKASLPRASVIRDGLVVFDIKGNDYRVAASVSFAHQIVRVLRVGTHAEYDRWSL